MITTVKRSNFQIMNFLFISCARCLTLSLRKATRCLPLEVRGRSFEVDKDGKKVLSSLPALDADELSFKETILGECR
jgi:hypothetical protein